MRQQEAEEAMGQCVTVSFGWSLHLTFPPLVFASYCSSAPAWVLHSLQSLGVYLPWHKFSMGHSASGVSLSQCGSSTSCRFSGVSCPSMGCSPSRVSPPAQSTSFQESISSQEPNNVPFHFSRHVSSHISSHLLLHVLLYLLSLLLVYLTSLLSCLLLLVLTHLFVPPAPCYLFMSFFVTPHVSFSASSHVSTHVCPYVCPSVSPFCDSCP